MRGLGTNDVVFGDILRGEIILTCGSVGANGFTQRGKEFYAKEGAKGIKSAKKE